jgi:phenylpyruvate tautomerase PptA (4-oxalocrotonate tautomerase family)
MPLVKIEILKGKSQDYKNQLLNGVHQALVQALRIPDEDRNQRLFELDKSNFEFRSNKTDNYTQIEITLFSGRSRDAKRNLYKAIVENLDKSPGIRPYDVFIVLLEVPMENWGIRGGKIADEVDLGFSVKV